MSSARLACAAAAAALAPIASGCGTEQPHLDPGKVTGATSTGATSASVSSATGAGGSAGAGGAGGAGAEAGSSVVTSAVSSVSVSSVQSSASVTVTAQSATVGAGGAGGGGGSGGGGSGGGGVVLMPVWAFDHGGGLATDHAFAAGVAVDPTGNVVVVGSFAGSVDFGGTVLVSAGGNDVFVAKYDAAGALVWVKQFGDAADQSPEAVAVDATGAIVVCGTFYGLLVFGAGAPTLDAAGSQFPDAFVAKLDATGAHLWSKRLGLGDADTDEAFDCSVGPSDSVVVIGAFQSAIHLDVIGNDPAPTATPLVAAGGNGDSDAFLAKYSATGQHAFGKRFGDAAVQQGIGVAVAADGTIALTGSTEGDIDLGGGALVNGAGMRGFVGVLDGAGAHKHSLLFKGPGTSVGRAVAFTPAGALYAAGNFQSSVDVGGLVVTGTGAGNDDVFVARYSAAGVTELGRGLGGIFTQRVEDLAVGPSGKPVLTGRFTTTLKLSATEQLAGAGGFDGWIVKLDEQGAPFWSLGFGDPSFQAGAGVAADAQDRALLVGNFSGTIDVGTGTLAMNAIDHFFVAKYAP